MLVGTSEVLSFVGGIIAGLLTNMLWDMRFVIRRRVVRYFESKTAVPPFEPSSVGLYPINRWSAHRPISQDQIEMHVIHDRPRQVWCDAMEWQHLADEFSRSYSGRIAYLIGFEVDHRESKHGASFVYSVTPCDYSEHLATARYLDDHPEVVRRICEVFRSGRLSEFASSAPPSLIKINVSLLNSNGRFLALQRSGAVHTKRGLWTTGPNETMRLIAGSVPGVRQEDLFDLAERCLREELALEPSDYETPMVSWIGYEASTASVKVFAHAYTNLSEQRVEEAAGSAHSVFEVQRLAWLPLTRRTIADIGVNWRTGDSGGRIWSSSAPFALHELWRMRIGLRRQL
jgi:hypothetical protein